MKKVLTVKQRFSTMFRKCKKTGCWVWTKSKTSKGYGRMNVDGKTVRAHRLAWKLYNGRIGKGKCVLHKCDNPSCVNPDHLFLGTNSDNTRDMMEKQRYFGKLKVKEVSEIKKLLKTHTQVELADKYNVSQSAISSIKTGRNWSHVT